jgi:hypothetical protein
MKIEALDRLRRSQVADAMQRIINFKTEKQARASANT